MNVPSEVMPTALEIENRALREQYAALIRQLADIEALRPRALVVHCDNPKACPMPAVACQGKPPSAAPAAQPLAKDRILQLWGARSDGPSNSELVSFARAIERAHGIGGTNA